MEARKAVAEKLGFTGGEILVDITVNHAASNAYLNAFNLCVSLQEDNEKLKAENLSLQERVDALEKSLTGSQLILEALHVSVEWELAPEIKAEIAKTVEHNRAALSPKEPGGVK